MVDMICIALSAKNLHNPDYSNLGQGWFFAVAMEVNRKGKYFITNIVYKRADQMIWPIQQKLFLGRCYS